MKRTAMLFNFRVFTIHFQLTENWAPRITHNPWHRKSGWPQGYVSLYQLGTKNFNHHGN